MKKSKTNLILIVSIILFLASLTALVYFINIIKNKNKHISAVVSTLEEKINEKENISILEKKVAELGDVENDLGSHIVDTSKVDTFVGYLENMGASNNVALSVKSVEVPKNVKNKVLVGINLAGDFTNIVKVIDLLENSPYNIIITSSYLNKELVQASDLVTGVDTPPGEAKSSWQADITFSVLSI